MLIDFFAWRTVTEPGLMLTRCDHCPLTPSNEGTKNGHHIQTINLTLKWPKLSFKKLDYSHDQR